MFALAAPLMTLAFPVNFFPNTRPSFPKSFTTKRIIISKPLISTPVTILPTPSEKGYLMLVTENIARAANYKDVVKLWINSPGHAANLFADTPYACVENYGNFYAYEGWKP